jgi:hypothetical protein
MQSCSAGVLLWPSGKIKPNKLTMAFVHRHLIESRPSHDQLVLQRFELACKRA